jgi:anti-sigma factor RsiW
MMPCPRYTQAIQERVDGTLGAIRAAELDQHLTTCASCRGFAADVQRVHDLAASLDRPAPPAAVWLQIAGRLRQEGRVQPPAPVQRGRHPRYALLAIAAALLLAIAGSLLVLAPYLRSGGGVEQAAATPPSGGNAAGGESVQSIEDHFRLAEQHMQTGIAKLEEAARVDQTVMDPQTAAMLKKNLELIDQAIAESRAALRAEPQSTIARNSLFNALRRKVALLQDTLALMNEMRKGDAAGAAQALEGLNKS